MSSIHKEDKDEEILLILQAIFHRDATIDMCIYNARQRALLLGAQ